MSVRQRQSRNAGWEVFGIAFGKREVADLALAWVALTAAFTFFLAPQQFIQELPLHVEALGRLFVMTTVAVGTGFLLHELAHKVVAIKFGQIAAFRADYGMLALAIFSGLAGFIFAAPGAVYHRGRITERENGIVAVAGPVVNLALVFAFVPLLLVGGFVGEMARLAILINAFLAAFNMIPFGPLDGRTVLDWSRAVFAIAFLSSVGVTAAAAIVLL